jgi:hypothetical protein
MTVKSKSYDKSKKTLPYLLADLVVFYVFPIVAKYWINEMILVLIAIPLACFYYIRVLWIKKWL